MLYDPIKNFLTWFQPFKKPSLVCIHGFGVRRSLEFTPLKTYFENLGYQVYIPNLFDQTIVEDNDPSMWIGRAEKTIKDLIERKQDIVLIGFSMGAVIASHLSTLYPTVKLILLAPAFEYLTVKNVSESAEKRVRTLVRLSKTINNIYPPLPDSFTPSFREVIRLTKSSVNEIQCPTLIFHGTQDEVIPTRSSEYAYRKIPHMQKYLYHLEGVNHRILDDERYQKDILAQIQHFIEK
jgi:esterase/lipase